MKRFNKRNPCPVCGSHPGVPQGTGQRCAGFFSDDGRCAYCQRTDMAGALPISNTSPPTYAHRLKGECGCGLRHDQGAPPPAAPTPAVSQLSRIVATFDYSDEQRNLLFQVVHYDPKAFKQRRPDGKGDWLWNLRGVRRVLYRLPDLLEALEADPDEWIFIPEGEKHVDRLWDLGLVASCNSGGAGKSDASQNAPLQGRRVALLPDNDVPGQRHVEKFAEQLAHHAAVVKVVVLPGLGPKGDILDWLAAGHDAVELLDLVEAAPEWESPAGGNGQPPGTDTAGEPGWRDLDRGHHRSGQFSSNGTNPIGPIPSVEVTERLPIADREFLLRCIAQQEYGDAQLLAHLYRDRLVFDHSIKEWYYWGGHYWLPDNIAMTRRLIAGELAAQYLILAAELGKEVEQAKQDSDTEKAEELGNQVEGLKKRATSLRNLRRIQRILEFGESFLGIVGNEWDRQPDLLACPNGVIDLKAGELSPGKPGDYLRNAIPTIWKGLNEPAPRFEEFTREIFDEVEEEAPKLSPYVQELFGYGITGHTLDHILAIFHGPRGRNGKDTLLETLGFVLGPGIASACSQDVFIGQARNLSPGGPSEHLYDLMGKRIIWASESAENARLNANQVKLITGGGQISCRRAYGHQTSFSPTHLPILITNFKPHAPDNDEALWERVHLIPFNLRFIDTPKRANERQRDPLLLQKLKTEASGILAWLVRGAMKWYAEGGLIAPDSVKLATSSYQAEMDPLADFIDDRCVRIPDARTSKEDLWQTYKEWTKDNHISHPLGRNQLGERIASMDGVTEVKSGKWYWEGIGLTVDERQYM